MKKKTYILAVACLVIVISFVIFVANRKPEIRHVILISIDTCRADYLSCYGYPKQTTPNIDAVAQHATRFEHVVSPVPITLPAHSSMLTGMIPPSHGVHNNIGFKLAPSNQTLAEVLKQNGYVTAGIVSSFVLKGELGLAQGFDVYQDSFIHEHRTKSGIERKGNETTQVALNWLEHNKADKSFLFLHYYDPHLNYEPPEPFATEYADNLYAGEVAFVDHCIGQVIQSLKDLDLYDSTLLIITADHGEMLGEHGEEEHTYFIYESAIRVPLIIKMPGQEEARTVAQPVGLIDIVPTICSLLGIDLPEHIQGRDVSSMLSGEIANDYKRHLYSESVVPTRVGASALMSVSTGEWKYIRAPRAELYNIEDDPGEKVNLIGSKPHRARILEDKLKQILEESVQKDLSNRIDVDVESIRKLQSLGYVATSEEGEFQFDESKEDPKDHINFFVRYQDAMTLVGNQDYDAAEEAFDRLVKERPDFYELYLQLGDIAVSKKDFEKAVIAYRRVVQLKPEQFQALNNLAWLQATRPSLVSRDAEEALLLARTVCKQTNFNNPNALDTLGVAYAAAGDFPKAIEIARRAHALAVAANDKVLAQKIKKRLELFEHSKPYVEE